jgi:small subunit ribosomal protein S1
LAEDLEDAFDMMLPLEGRVTETCNGGFRVQILGKTAFCPISQIDLRRVDDANSYVGKKFEFLITQFSERGRNIVVSRKKLLEEQKEASQAAFTEDHKPGDLMKGIVTRLEKFGAFIELAPGLEGLAHISELSWSRLADPAEAVNVGQEVNVKILRIEQGANGRTQISLSVKAAEPEPWLRIPDSLAPGKVVEGKIARCMKFGAFVELIPGIEGLIPLSEMSYTKRVLRAEEIVKEGERVQVMIKEIRPEERRISLSLRDAQGGDPWTMVPVKYAVGTVARGRVERREPYGLFIKLEDGVTGLLPKSKALESPDFPYDKLKLGDEIAVQVAELRLEEKKIALGAPSDPDADAWRSASQTLGGSKSLGTFGDQFKSLFEQGKNKKS